MGKPARPTPVEAEGPAGPVELEPFRSLKESPPDDRWQYPEDVVLEVIAEAMPLNLRALEQAICDFSKQFRTPHFFCSPEHADMAVKTNGTLCDITERRFAERGISRPGYSDVPWIAPIQAAISQAEKYCQGIVRSLIAMDHLLFNSDCRHALSQNPLALKALGLACFVGVTYHLGAVEPPSPDHIELCETYQ